MKKALLIAIIAMLIIALGGVAATAMFLSTPSNVATASFFSLINGITERDEIAPIVDTFNKGSLQFSLDSIEYGGTNVIENSEFHGKLYFADDEFMLTDVDLQVNDTTISGELYVSDDKIYVSEDNILGGAYGFNVSELASQFENSIFAYGSGSDYELSKTNYENYLALFKSLEDAPRFKKDYKNLSKTVSKDIWKIVLNNSEVTAENVTAQIEDKETDVKLVKIIINANAMEGILRDVYDYLLNSPDIEKFITDHEEAITVNPLFDRVYDETKYDSLYNAYTKWLVGIEEDIDHICNNIKDDFDTVTVQITTPKFGAKLLKLEISIEDETVLSLDCGSRGIKYSDKIVLTTDDFSITYEVKESNKKRFDASLILREGKDFANISLLIDKENGKYTVDVEHGYKYFDYATIFSYEITGNITTNIFVTTLTVDKMISTEVHDYGDTKETVYENAFEFGCELVTHRYDIMPDTLDNFKNISDITDSDIDAWIEKIEIGNIGAPAK